MLPFALCIFMLFWRRGAAQLAISTSIPVPPLQWLNVKELTSGSAPPPLKDSAIGYDESTRTLIIFGGESQAGLPQQATYLLNLDSLIWSTPETKVPTQTSNPPARSRALGTGDFAANSRRDFVIFGGKGSGDEALADVWAFDYLNQFWVDVSLSASDQPQPRWGAIGGIDPSVIPGSGNNVNTTFYITGGSDGAHTFPPSDLWQLVITGTLASDVTTIQGKWESIPLTSTLAGKSEAGGTLISKNQASGARLIISGGCGNNLGPLDANNACIDPTTYVLTVGGSSISPSQCPTPRLAPAIVPNLNPSSSSFASQAFMLLGTFDSTQWDDDEGLSKGEVAVLDADAGTWARVLPAGDPRSPGGSFPTPRQGAAVFAFPSALVGENRKSSSDIIVFGGQDAQRNYLNDLWILRSYNDSITHSGDHWQGFGNGQLQSGIGASGAGVTVHYLAQCAQRLGPTTTSGSMGPRITNRPGQPASSDFSLFDVSIVHKVLSPVSVALALAATFVARLASPTDYSSGPLDRHRTLMYITISAGVISYGFGVAGFANSFTSTSRPESHIRRRTSTDNDTFLKTQHGQAGFALFLGLYGVVPITALLLWLSRRRRRAATENVTDEPLQNDSEETGAISGEKDVPDSRRATSPSHSAPEVHSAESTLRRQRAHSGPGLFPGWRSKDTLDPGPVPPPTRSFEVVNRPRRASSGGMVLYPLRDFSQRPRTDITRTLNDISWLERRRSVGVVGELDYALSQLPHASPRSVSPPVTSRPPTVTMSNRPFVRTPTPQPISTSQLNGWDVALRIVFHLFLLANCILALTALFSSASLATFIVFLIWILVFYIFILILAWNGRPGNSILSIAIARLRAPVPGPPPVSTETESPVEEERSTNLHSPPPGRSPYVYHQPPWRRAVSLEEEATTWTSHGGQPTVEAEDADEEDADDDDRQRHMEEELMRRDVNIVTVPRRKLWITNPS